MRRRSAINRRSNNHNLAPPPFQPEITVGKTLRYQAVSALSATPITSYDLSNLIVFSTSASTSARLFASVKIRKLEIWGAMGQNLSPVTCDIEYVANNVSFMGSKRELHSDTSMGTRPAHVTASPSSRAVAGQWIECSVGGAVDYARISCPAGSIIDIHVTFVVRSTESAISGPVCSGASVGRVYYVPLTGASSQTVPLSVSSLPGV